MAKEKNTGPKIQTEKETVAAMIQLYCQKKHGNKENICEECEKLNLYAQARLDFCSFGEGKPTCRKCSRHCYSNDMKILIRNVMRFSGPRMIFYHPVFAFKHILKEIL